MSAPKKTVDKDAARQRRRELHEAINRGELSLQEAVKAMRKLSRLTQTEFAAHRGVSAKVIKEIERGIGNPTVNTLNRIGQFFGLEVAFIRSEKLQRRGGQIAPATPAQDVFSTETDAAILSQIEQARRLTQALENWLADIQAARAALKPLDPPPPPAHGRKK